MAATAPAEVQRRVERLNAASLARIIEPDEEVVGHVGDGQLLPDELLLASAGLDPGTLDDQQMVRLGRETVAAVAAGGIMLESVLMAGFSVQISRAEDITDPRITYLLHEMGEETRHSRLFVRLIEQIRPTARNPLDRFPMELVARFVVGRIISMPALLHTMVLAGEEIPDLLQKRAAEHPDTDPFLRAVNTYHRQEEARHLAFARMVLPEVWERANPIDRFVVHNVAPIVIREMYENLIHAGVFQAVGLPGIRAWQSAREHPRRVALRHDATRPVLAALVGAGAVRSGHVPPPWRQLCGVDAGGEPTT
jgi:hypothetical protein